MMEGKFFLGKWAFFAGLLIAILSGFLMIPGVSIVMFILGIAVGFLNMRKKDINSYLIAIIALIVVSTGILSLEESYASLAGIMAGALSNFIVFVSASGFVIAIRSIFLIDKF